MDYREFLQNKTISDSPSGFDIDEGSLNPMLFDFQKAIVKWALRQGRAAIFADCGLGKTPMQLEWAQKIAERENGKILIITPLAVSHQTIREGAKFGIECKRSARGEMNGCKISVTNYERLHYFNPHDFVAVVCDESSAIKNFEGKRKKIITDFMRKTKYRLLCTATAAPNDFIELGTSSEALGYLGRMDMLGTFFKNDENSLHPIWWVARWRFKAHAEEHFWRWVCSWARAIRKPSDIGFDDSAFTLPELNVRELLCDATEPLPGELFVKKALTLDEQRKERRITLPQRCAMIADIVKHDRPALVWCHLNSEADLLEKLIPDGKQIKGGDTDEQKEETFLNFIDGKLRVLITKPKIGAFGLNLQHCSHVTFFPSHSFEQYYQGVRRCWRFGQQNVVDVDIVTTPGEMGVLQNLQRKAKAADEMFTRLVEFMSNELKINREDKHTNEMEIPSWL
jgi:hypothetical protein